MESDRTLSSQVRTWLFLIASIFASVPVVGVSQQDTLSPGDTVQIGSGKYRGTVVSVQDGKATVFLVVPVADLTKSKPGEPSPPAKPVSKYAGTWQSTDRTLVIKDETKFRVLWEDGVKIHVDDGTYTMSGDKKTFLFRSDKGTTFPWRLDGIDGKQMTLSHAEVGTRVFQKVAVKTGDAFVGRWDVQYTKNGVAGTSKMYLYRDGIYLIYEYDRFGNFDHSEHGTWSSEGKTSLSIKFYYAREGRHRSVQGSLENITKDSFVWRFSSLGGLRYVYNCQRRKD